MIQLPRWVLTSKHPAFYDMESATTIEQTAKVYGAMQTLIEEYNTFAANTEKTINDFMSNESSSREVFEIAMRQEFQDFIDTVEMELVAQTNKLINDAIQDGRIRITEVYNNDTESLDLVMTGGV